MAEFATAKTAASRAGAGDAPAAPVVSLSSFGDRFRSRAVILGIASVDALVVAFAFLAATALRFAGNLDVLDASDLPAQAGIVSFLMLAGLTRADAYEFERLRSGQELLTRIVLGAITGFFLVMLASYIAPGIAPGRGVFALHAVLTVLALLVWRRFIFRVLRESQLRPRALVLGEAKVARKVAAALDAAAIGGAEVVGILGPPRGRRARSRRSGTTSASARSPGRRTSRSSS